MALINTHKFHALKILTVTLSFGALHPSDAAETPKTTDTSALNSDEERGKRLLKEWDDNRSVYSPLKTTTNEENLKMAEEIEEESKQLLTEIDQLKSEFSPFKIITKTYAIASFGIGLFQYMGLSPYLSVFFPVTAATLYYLNSLDTLKAKKKEIEFRSLSVHAKVSTLRFKNAGYSLLAAFSVALGLCSLKFLWSITFFPL